MPHIEGHPSICIHGTHFFFIYITFQALHLIKTLQTFSATRFALALPQPCVKPLISSIACQTVYFQVVTQHTFALAIPVIAFTLLNLASVL